MKNYELLEKKKKKKKSFARVIGIMKELEKLYLNMWKERIYGFNPLMPGGNKKVTKQNFQLQVCLSMRDLFVTTRH